MRDILQSVSIVLLGISSILSTLSVSTLRRRVDALETQQRAQQGDGR